MMCGSPLKPLIICGGGGKNLPLSCFDPLSWPPSLHMSHPVSVLQLIWAGSPEASPWSPRGRAGGRSLLGVGADWRRSGAPRLAWIIPNAVPAQPADTRQSPHASGGSLEPPWGQARARGVDPLSPHWEPGTLSGQWPWAGITLDTSHILCRFFLMTLWRSRGDCSHYTTKEAAER